MTDHHDFEKSQVEYWMEKICSDVGWMQCWTLFGLQAATCGMPFGREISELKMRHLLTGGGGVWGCSKIRDATIIMGISRLPLTTGAIVTITPPPPPHHLKCDHTLYLFTFPWPIAHQSGRDAPQDSAFGKWNCGFTFIDRHCCNIIGVLIIILVDFFISSPSW